MLMKKRLLLLPIACLAMVTSCAEEEMPFSTGTSEQQVIQPELDLTFGYNSIITETDSLSSVSIPLNSCVPVSVSCRDGFADLKCVNVDGKYYLQVANPEKAQLGVDKITLTVNGHPELTKSFLFTVNKSINESRGVVDENRLMKRFAEIFSVGRYLWQGATDDHPLGSMLNYKVLLNTVDTDTALIQKDVNFRPNQEYEKITGSSLEEHSTNYAWNLGISKFPVGKFTGSFSHTGTRKSVSKNYYEYLTESRIDQNAAAFMTVNLTSIPPHSEKWKTVISKELDNVLNNPNSDQYKKFSENDKGACEIIEHYGSHLLTYCILGAQATLDFHKKQDMTKTSLDLAFSVSFRQKKKQVTNEQGEVVPDKDPTTWSEVKAAEYISNKQLTIDAGFKFSNEDYLEETEAGWSIKLVAGNSRTVNGFDGWNSTDDPENWVPVAYRQNKNVDTDLIAIYEFCQDETSKRCQTLKHVLEDVDEKGICPFLRYMSDENHYNLKLDPDETEWVLADVFVDVDAKKSDDGIPKPKKKTFKNGDRSVTYTLYPFKDLAFNKGDCLDTQTNQFGRIGIGACHYWYYAMAMRDDCPGISDIRLVEDSKESQYHSKGYYRCMDDKATNFGDNWGCWESYNYILMAKRIPLNDTETKPITGLRLEAWDDYLRQIKKNEDVVVLGVSGGTGYEPSGLNKEEVYYKYWHEAWMNKWEGYPKSGVPESSTVLNTSNEKSAVYMLRFVHQPWYLFLSTIKTPIKGKNFNLVIPNNMKNRN